VTLGGVQGITFTTLAEPKRRVFAWGRDRELPVALYPSVDSSKPAINRRFKTRHF
jgi:hypothetical protein